MYSGGRMKINKAQHKIGNPAVALKLPMTQK